MLKRKTWRSIITTEAVRNVGNSTSVFNIYGNYCPRSNIKVTLSTYNGSTNLAHVKPDILNQISETPLIRPPTGHNNLKVKVMCWKFECR